MAFKVSIYLMEETISLFEIADELLEYADEDDHRLARAISRLDPEIREELLVSDFLNAYQVYLYAFTEEPSVLIMDRLLLQPASGLVRGVFLETIEYFDLYFMMEGETPLVGIRCDKEVITSMRGRNAHHEAIRYAQEHAE